MKTGEREAKPWNVNISHWSGNFRSLMQCFSNVSYRWVRRSLKWEKYSQLSKWQLTRRKLEISLNSFTHNKPISSERVATIESRAFSKQNFNCANVWISTGKMISSSFSREKKTNTKHMDGFKEKTSERKRKSEEERYSNRNTKYNTCDYFLCIQITAKIASIWIMSNTHRKINKTNITIAIINFCSSWKSIQNIYGEKNLFAIRNSERAFNQRYLRLRDKF